MSWPSSFPLAVTFDHGEPSASPPFQLPPLGVPQNTTNALSTGPYLSSGPPSGTTAAIPRSPLPQDAIPVGAQLIGRVVDAVALLNSQFPAYHFTVRPDGGLSIVASTDGQRVTSCPYPSCEMGFINRRSNCISRHYQTEHAPNTLPFLCGGQCRSRTNRRDHFLSHLKRNKARCAAYLIHRAPVDPDVDKMLRLLYPESREPSWQIALVRDTNASMVDAQLRKLGTCLEIMVPGATSMLPSNPAPSQPPQVPSHPLHPPLPYTLVNGASSVLHPEPIAQQQPAYSTAPSAQSLGASYPQQSSPAQQYLPAPPVSLAQMPSYIHSYTATRASLPSQPNTSDPAIHNSFSQRPYISQQLASTFGPVTHPVSLPAPHPQYSSVPSSTWMPVSNFPCPSRTSQPAVRAAVDALVGWNGSPTVMPTSHACTQPQVLLAVHDDDLSWLTGPPFQAPTDTTNVSTSTLPPIPSAPDSTLASTCTYTYSASLSPANSSPLVISSGHKTNTLMVSCQGSTVSSAHGFTNVGLEIQSGQPYSESVVDGRGLAPPSA